MGQGHSKDTLGLPVPITMHAASDDKLKHFLVNQEIETWRPGIPKDIFMDDTLDLYQFMDIAMEAAHQESPLLQPIPALEVPDFNYETARIFHHYFSQYHSKLPPDLSLIRTADQEIIEFILQEYSKDPMDIPLEQAEEQTFQLNLIKFLISPEGQCFFSSIYTCLFEESSKIKPEFQAFVILYWRYKKYWKQKLKMEQAPIADITRFLSKHYMEYW